jgi:hypothetical protein
VSVVRQYKNEDVLVQIKGLDQGLRVRVHLEHRSGAALIVPECDARVHENGYDLEMRGFDGTGFKMTLDEPERALRIFATAPTPLLGDKAALELPRAEDLGTPQPAPLRITGDEVTRPIGVKK